MSESPNNSKLETRNSNLPAVEVRDLEKRFGRFLAVDKVSFAVRAGEIFGFLGPNGAGKSTTIRMLCGILAPSGGSGSVAGLDIRTQSEQIKARIGYMSQRFSLYEDLTVEENIDFFSGIYRIPAAHKTQRKAWVLEMAGLKDLRASRTGVLSGGWKQRLALGCAVLHEPPIVFLDEPTSGVDPVSRRRFWELIYQMAQNHVTVFVTTHYMDEAEYCDRLGLIYRGRLIASGTPEELKTKWMQQAVLEVVCDRPSEAIGVLEALSGVHEAALFGQALHVVIARVAGVSPARGQDARDTDGPAGRELIAHALNEAGFPVQRLEEIAPSLEDVFLSLIESHDRQAGPQVEVKR